LERVLPQAPDKALNTIHGVVRVSVRVHVDAAGNVSQAELEAPGPSRYFADLALKAAEKWVFGSPVLDGKSVPSEWLIRFEYTQSGVVALPQQTAP
jgi:TonB family protein